MRAGRKPMPTYSHIEWDAIPYVPGSLHAVAYVNGSVATDAWRNTSGPVAAMQISVKDGFGTQLIAGCADVALVQASERVYDRPVPMLLEQPCTSTLTALLFAQVSLVDASGNVVNGADNVVTFSVSGPATFGGGGAGDPACHTPDKSPSRPAFHGWVLAVIQGGDGVGSVTVSASTPGLAPVSVTIPQAAPPSGFTEKWCHLEPQL